jgi:hypothetical protein
MSPEGSTSAGTPAELHAAANQAPNYLISAKTPGHGERTIPQLGPKDTIDRDTCQSTGLCPEYTIRS